jgi:transposase
LLILCGFDSEQTMRRNLFWLTDEQWQQIEPHLPKDVRGKARVDDRRVISGIVHVIKSGCRWCDWPPEYGPPTTIYNRFVRWAERGVWERLFRELAPHQAIGRSRGGRNTKVHANADAKGRLLAVLLTGGQAHVVRQPSA